MTPSPELVKFLNLIAFSEGTSRAGGHPLTKLDGYDVIVSGIDGPEVFTDLTDHPFHHRAPKLIRENPSLSSTASGRYQLLYRWYTPYCVQLGLHGFGQASQDAIALQQIKERGAIELILAGDIESAIKACSTTWASLPGNNYGQGGRSLVTLLDWYGAQGENA